MKTGITIGDPAGIGPELVLRAIPELRNQETCIVFGNKKILKKTADDLRLQRNYSAIKSQIVEATENIRWEYGRSTRRTARVALQSIQKALESGVELIVTAPIVKATMRLVMPDFIGHTEYLAQFFRVKDYAMTGLWRDKRIMLLTTHVPLRHVFKGIDADLMVRKASFFAEGLKRYFAIQNPDIAFSALNPHAFEFSLGEDEEIRRAVDTLKKKGYRVKGPFPADTLFSRDFDGFIAVYHDQAMVYLKSKKNGLNFTLGLPIIRLSPLCGAALDIAGRGIAEISGFVAALRVGKQLYNNMRRYDAEKKGH